MSWDCFKCRYYSESKLKNDCTPPCEDNESSAFDVTVALDRRNVYFHLAFANFSLGDKEYDFTLEYVDFLQREFPDPVHAVRNSLSVIRVNALIEKLANEQGLDKPRLREEINDRLNEIEKESSLYRDTTRKLINNDEFEYILRKDSSSDDGVLPLGEEGEESSVNEEDVLEKILSDQVLRDKILAALLKREGG